jgi:transcriptional regulator with XRE-family HTH domain
MKSFSALLTRRMEQVHVTTTELAMRLGMTVKDAWDLRRGIASPNTKRIAELAPLLQVTELQLQTAIDQQTQSVAAKVWD